MDYNLHKLRAEEISLLIREKRRTVQEVYEYFQKRIAKFNSALNAVVRSIALDKFSPPNSLLAGVPIIIKDNICIKEVEITCASKILKGFISPYDAGVIKRLKENSLIPLAIANMDEFAFGSSCETSCYGPARNPWDKNKVPGGSSGGSAAAVAAGFAPLALGSDTGGSIRQPASFCGVVGFKPTYGRVSRFGLVAFGSSLDQIGPLCRDIRDCAAVLEIISGYDENDSTSVEKPASFRDYLKEDIKGVRIGIPREYFTEGVDKEVEKVLGEALKVLKSRGAVIEEMSLPHTEYAVPVYYIVASSEASSNLSRFDGVRYGLRQNTQTLTKLYTYTRAQGFGREAKRRILLGTFSLSSGYYDAYYLKALKARTLIKQEFEKVFQYYDVIISPTSPTTAFALGEKINDPLKMYLSDVFTIPANLAGIPAASIPCGFDKKGLPVGMQIIGPAFGEGKIINIAFSYQSVTNWHNMYPADYEGN